MLQREIDPEIRADIEKFEEQLARYLSGDLAEDGLLLEPRPPGNVDPPSRV